MQHDFDSQHQLVRDPIQQIIKKIIRKFDNEKENRNINKSK